MSLFFLIGFFLFGNSGKVLFVSRSLQNLFAWVVVDVIVVDVEVTVVDVDVIVVVDDDDDGIFVEVGGFDAIFSLECSI